MYPSMYKRISQRGGFVRRRWDIHRQTSRIIVASNFWGWLVALVAGSTSRVERDTPDTGLLPYQQRVSSNITGSSTGKPIYDL